MLGQIATITVTVGILVLGGLWGWQWLREDIPYPAVVITAAHDVVEHGIPVFAQFVITQRLTLSEPHKITKLTLPVWMPRSDVPLVIELRQEGELLGRWRYYGSESEEAVEVSVPVALPAEVAGILEVRLASALTHEEQVQAPRVFIESSDHYYPSGNYRIAENEKAGDLSLTLSAQQPRWQLLEIQRRTEPWLAARQYLRWLMAGLVITAVPQVLLSLARPKSRQGFEG